MAAPPSKARCVCRTSRLTLFSRGLTHFCRCFAAPQVKVLIIGAGPTGLGAATRLHQRGHPDWALIDQARRLARALRRLQRR